MCEVCVLCLKRDILSIYIKRHTLSHRWLSLKVTLSYILESERKRTLEGYGAEFISSLDSSLDLAGASMDIGSAHMAQRYDFYDVFWQDRTRDGSRLGKTPPKFYKNFGKTSPKTRTTQFIPASKMYHNRSSGHSRTTDHWSSHNSQNK